MKERVERTPPPDLNGEKVKEKCERIERERKKQKKYRKNKIKIAKISNCKILWAGDKKPYRLMPTKIALPDCPSHDVMV